MDASHLAPLLTPEGWALLADLPPYDESTALSVGQALRDQGHSPALVSAALTQQRLRGRAEAKFGPFTSQMLFTPDGLEQATRLAVSAHHAARYARAGVRRVADLGCGIGGDAMALSGLGLKVLAVERDEATAALATVNLMAFPEAEVLCADALELDLAARGVDAVFADPARRADGRRVSDPEQWSPALGRVLALREDVEALGVKVAPGIDHAALPADAHVQWVSVGGDVVEAGIWCGPLAEEGPGRSALVLPDGGPQGGPAARTLRDPDCDDPSTPPVQLAPLAEVGDLRTYIHEPDGAAIRAGLVAHLAQQLDAVPVGERIAYLSGDRLPDAALAPFVRSWRVREALPLSLKSLKSRVRERGIGSLEIRKRGLPVSPETVRAAVRPTGEAHETWVMTRLGPREDRTRGVVVVVEPCPEEPPAEDPASAS
mgnify:FL=1